MKKIIFIIFVFMFLLGVTKIMAKEEKRYQAEEIKIYKKTKLTEEQKEFISQRKKLNLKDKLKKPSANIEAATGILGEEVKGNKYAVLVGICDYPGVLNDICLSDGDALNMRTALLTKYGFSEENIYYFPDQLAIKTNIKSKIDFIKNKVTADDEMVFFFSGHGTNAKVNDGDREKLDEGIVVYDTNDTLGFIWDGELRDWFTGFNASRIVFIFDSCLAGGMNDVAGNGRLVVMSSKENQSSYVYSSGENGEGVFSHWFVNLGMIQGEADGINQLGYKNQTVEVEEAFQYAKNNINTLQLPILSDNFPNDLLLGN